MFRRRRRMCCYMNDCKKCDKDILEDKCQKIDCCEDYNNMNNCMCGFDEEDSVFPQNPMYGQSYVPVQQMDETFKPCVGLKKGTIFPELVSKYEPCQSMREIAYLEASNEIGEGCNNGR